MLRLPHLSAAALLLLAAAAAQAQEPLPAPAPLPEPVPAPLPPPPQPYAQEQLQPYPVAAPEPPLAPAPALPPPAPEAPPLPDRLSVGKLGGFVQPGSLLQFWGVATHSDALPGTDTTFRLRRAEFRIKGELAPKLVSYVLMLDVAKIPAFTATPSNVNVVGPDGATIGTVPVPQPTLAADRSPLQDVAITFISEYADVSVGQFKIPVSLEALQSSSKLLFPERSRVSREFGDRRDIGIKVEKKIGDVFYYYAGLFNGQGPNALDADRRKDVGLRLEAYPIPGLTLGVLGYGTVGGRDLAVRDRLEADVRLEIANFIVQGEYIHGWTGAPNRRFEGHGVVGAAGYTFLERFQPVARIGLLDTNLDDLAPRTEAESGALRFFEVGFNYLLRGNDIKLGLALGHFSQEHGADITEGTLLTQLNF
jgi:hypothetical protein